MRQADLFATGDDELAQGILRALERGPLTLRELVVAVLGRDPGPADHLPEWAVPLNRARQSLQRSCLVGYVLHDDGEHIATPTRYQITEHQEHDVKNRQAKSFDILVERAKQRAGNPIPKGTRDVGKLTLDALEGRGEAGPTEAALVHMLVGICGLADAYAALWDQPIGQGGPIADEWVAAARATLHLLGYGDGGRLDGGIVDAGVREVARAAGFPPETVDQL